MTDQLTAALDRFVADQSPAVPPIAEVRSRARCHRRRRLTTVSAAAVLTLGTVATVWAVRPDPDPQLLRVADGEVRLNDWITLTWLPADVTAVQDDGTNLRPGMEVFGYWQGHFSLRRGVSGPITFNVALGDPYDVHLEATVQDDAVIVGDRVELARGARSTVIARIGVATIQVSGADLVTLHHLVDAMVVDTPTIDLPGSPVTVATGEIEGVPWDLRITTPAPGIAWDGLASDGTCLTLRVYVASLGCLGTGDRAVTTTTLDSPWDEDPTIGPGWLLLGAADTARFEYTRPDGTTATVEARPATPALGAFAVIDVGDEGQITDIRALAADGTVLGESPF